ncbi:hypothetical protein [Methanosarcina horonobensis]|uniref:hypothetical protein n=1 Tax=Methanosarcina horonobensis TaxID=418008 RepID=UPI0022B871B8|nr:hypothetical protein [Methanosarcina horonobensis]
MVGDIQMWLTFGLSAKQEDHFRRVNFSADIIQARILIFLIILPFAVLVVNDYSFFGLSPIFYMLLALRLAIITYTILFFKSLRFLHHSLLPLLLKNDLILGDFPKFNTLLGYYLCVEVAINC